MTKNGDAKTHFEQEQTAKKYEAYYDTKYKRADQLEKKLLAELLAQFPHVKSIVEVGCGTGPLYPVDGVRFSFRMRWR